MQYSIYSSTYCTNKPDVVDNVVQFLLLCLLDTILVFVPMKRRRLIHRPKWMTKCAQKAIDRKYKSWKKNRESRSCSDYLLYKRNVNIASCEIRKAKRNLDIKLAHVSVILRPKPNPFLYPFSDER